MNDTNNINNLKQNDTNTNNTKKRVSKHRPQLVGLAKTHAKDEIVAQLTAGQLTQGQMLKKLRVEVLGFKQDEFAKIVKVSRKTLSDVENDKGNYSVNTINQIFRPFGLKLGLVLIS